MNFEEKVLSGRIPEHIAVIMDGNRRWAKQKNLPTRLGHREGALRVTDLVKYCGDVYKRQDIAMQVAAMSPKYISMEDVDEEFIAQEKEILTAQALNEGKPQNIVEKMVLGRLNKELKEICLLEQAFVKDRCV